MTMFLCSLECLFGVGRRVEKAQVSGKDAGNVKMYR